MTALAIPNISDAVVARGQRAWGKIKATAAEQRELWKQVGEALLVGRKENPSNQGFGMWCKDNGFGDIAAPVRADAMWYAASYNDCKTAPTDMSHPTNLRTWYREYKKDTSLPEELKDVSITIKAIPEMDERTAEKVGKLSRRALSDDEGSEIAKRHLDAVAKKHGVSTEDLTNAASTTAPQAFYQFTPAQIDLLREIEGNVLATVVEMEATGLDRAAIAKVFINVAQKILKEQQK